MSRHNLHFQKSLAIFSVEEVCESEKVTPFTRSNSALISTSVFHRRNRNRLSCANILPKYLNSIFGLEIINHSHSHSSTSLLQLILLQTSRLPCYVFCIGRLTNKYPNANELSWAINYPPPSRPPKSSF